MYEIHINPYYNFYKGGDNLWEKIQTDGCIATKVYTGVEECRR